MVLPFSYIYKKKSQGKFSFTVDRASDQSNLDICQQTCHSYINIIQDDITIIICELLCLSTKPIFTCLLTPLWHFLIPRHFDFFCYLFLELISLTLNRFWLWKNFWRSIRGLSSFPEIFIKIGDIFIFT